MEHEETQEIFCKSIDFYNSQYVAYFKIVAWGLSAYEKIILWYL